MKTHIIYLIPHTVWLIVMPDSYCCLYQQIDAASSLIAEKEAAWVERQRNSIELVLPFQPVVVCCLRERGAYVLQCW